MQIAGYAHLKFNEFTTRFYVTTLKPKPSFTSDDLINAELPRSSVHCPHEIKVDKAQIDNALLDVSDESMLYCETQLHISRF